MLITIFYTLVLVTVVTTLLIGALVKGGKNLLQKLVAIVGYGGKLVLNLLTTNIVRTLIFATIGFVSAITMTVVAIIIVII